MKNIVYTFLITVLLVSCTANGKNEVAHKKIKPQDLEPNVPLLVVTGFGNEQENISLKDLKEQYCAGKVFVLEAVKAEAQRYFGCENKNVLASLKDFATIAKDKYLLTDLQNSIAQFKALKIDSISFFGDADRYPLTNPNKERTNFQYKKQVTHFILTGVTAITRHMGVLADRDGTDYLTENLLPHFKEADLVHVSNEVSISDNCTYNAPNAAYSFCTKEPHLKPIFDLGADIVELTGNHNLDYGVEAYKKTMAWYEKNNLKTFGGGLTPEQANTPLVITLKDGKKLGFIGFNELCPCAECADKAVGANRYEREKAKAVLEKMRKELKIDIIFVGVQFGEVDSYAPTPAQNKISYDLLDFGADVVYGSQAHQIQQIEFRQGKAIFHGLGNFLFDQMHRIGVRQAYFLHNYFYNGKIVQSVPVFTFMSEKRKPTLASPAEIKQMKQVAYLDNQLYKW